MTPARDRRGYGRFHSSHTPKPELRALYQAETVRSLGLGIGWVFVPVFLMHVGYVLWQIAAIFLSAEMVKLLIDSVLGSMMANPRHRAKFLIASYACTCAALVWLHQVQGPTSETLMAVAILFGMSEGLRAIPYHCLFSESRSVGETGRQIGVMDVLTSTMSALGPLLGGILLVTKHFGFVFLFGALVFSLSAIPLFLLLRKESLRTTQAEHCPSRLGGLASFRAYHRRAIRDLTSYAGAGIDALGTYLLWPWFIFVIHGSALLTGLVASVAMVSGTLGGFGFAWLGDAGHRNRVLKVGGRAASGIQIVRAAVAGLAGTAGVTVLGPLAGSAIRSAQGAEFYDHASDYGESRFIVAMEIGMSIGRVFYWILMVAMLRFLPIRFAFDGAFVVAGSCALAIPLMNGQNRRIGAAATLRTERCPSIDALSTVDH
jgi:MFS family permease